MRRDAGQELANHRKAELYDKAKNERDATKRKLSELQTALEMAIATLEGHLDEPQAVTHAEMRATAKKLRKEME